MVQLSEVNKWSKWSKVFRFHRMQKRYWLVVSHRFRPHLSTIISNLFEDPKGIWPSWNYQGDEPFAYHIHWIVHFNFRMRLKSVGFSQLALRRFVPLDLWQHWSGPIWNYRDGFSSNESRSSESNPSGSEFTLEVAHWNVTLFSCSQLRTFQFSPVPQNGENCLTSAWRPTASHTWLSDQPLRDHSWMTMKWPALKSLAVSQRRTNG